MTIIEQMCYNINNTDAENNKKSARRTDAKPKPQKTSWTNGLYDLGDPRYDRPITGAEFDEIMEGFDDLAAIPLDVLAQRILARNNRLKAEAEGGLQPEGRIDGDALTV